MPAAGNASTASGPATDDDYLLNDFSGCRSMVDGLKANNERSEIDPSEARPSQGARGAEPFVEPGAKRRGDAKRPGGARGGEALSYRGVRGVVPPCARTREARGRCPEGATTTGHPERVELWGFEPQTPSMPSKPVSRSRSRRVGRTASHLRQRSDGVAAGLRESDGVGSPNWLLHKREKPFQQPDQIDDTVAGRSQVPRGRFASNAVPTAWCQRHHPAHVDLGDEWPPR